MKGIFKKGVCLMLSAVMMATVVSSTVFASGEEDNVGDPESISSLVKLKEFRTKINNGTLPANTDAILTANIDMQGENWEPIGNEEHIYTGTFNGNFKSISNLKIQGNGLSHCGFFSLIGGGANISNLNFINPVVQNILTHPVEGNQSHSGVLVGKMAKIENKETKVSSVKIINPKVKESNIAGGLIGKACHLIDISDCSVEKGEINGGTVAGGIMGSFMGDGRARPTMGTINDCTSIENKISADKYHSGGIIGEASSLIFPTFFCINSCKNSSFSVGKASSGGIVGLGHRVQIKKSSNTGMILGDKNAEEGKSVCGGIIGDGYNSKVLESINYGLISDSYYVGGISGLFAGSLPGQVSEVDKCVNMGQVSNAKYIGGISGMVVNTNIKNSYNKSKEGNCNFIDSKVSAFGGILGKGEKTNKVMNCYNQSDVLVIGILDHDHEMHIGGIIGEIVLNSKVVNTYYTGSLSDNPNKNIKKGSIIAKGSVNSPYRYSSYYLNAYENTDGGTPNTLEQFKGPEVVSALNRKTENEPNFLKWKKDPAEPHFPIFVEP